MKWIVGIYGLYVAAVFVHFLPASQFGSYVDRSYMYITGTTVQEDRRNANADGFIRSVLGFEREERLFANAKWFAENVCAPDANSDLGRRLLSNRETHLFAIRVCPATILIVRMPFSGSEVLKRLRTKTPEEIRRAIYFHRTYGTNGWIVRTTHELDELAGRHVYTRQLSLGLELHSALDFAQSLPDSGTTLHQEAERFEREGTIRDYESDARQIPVIQFSVHELNDERAQLERTVLIAAAPVLTVIGLFLLVLSASVVSSGGSTSAGGTTVTVNSFRSATRTFDGWADYIARGAWH